MYTLELEVPIKRPVYMVCLTIENLKWVTKNHQKKVELKTAKINPTFDCFSKGTEIAFDFLVLTDNNFYVHGRRINSLEQNQKSFLAHKHTRICSNFECK